MVSVNESRIIELEVGNTLTEELLDERLPELDEIEDDDLRAETKEAFLELCPDYFWERNASTSYHHPSTRGEGGLHAHTKMVVTVWDRLADSYTKRDLFDQYDADCVLVGILLHDMFKSGIEPALDSTSSYHDRLARAVFEHNTDLPEEVLHAVDAHNGPWFEGDQPEDVFDWSNEDSMRKWLIAELVHVCDMVGSAESIHCGILEPNGELRSSLPSYIERSGR